MTVSSEALGSIRSSRSTKFVDTVRKETKGLKIVAVAFSTPINRNARASDFCIAIFFGTSSPRTREK